MANKNFSTAAPLVLAMLAGVSLAVPAHAAVNIEYVTVGDVGNAADTVNPNPGYGAVGYEYQIGKYEVTNSEYAQFLNAKGESNAFGIFSSEMVSRGITQSGSSGSYSYTVTTGFENKPVVYVSWFDAARFTNWLANGQGTADMEFGSYTLDGATTGIIAANPGATVYLPTEDEWYKAAYYNGTTSSYSLYPNNQNTIATSEANFNNTVGAVTDVGTYSADLSYYGTFDQGGNVWEWNDAVIDGTSRGLRGSAWFETYDFLMMSSTRSLAEPWGEGDGVGFRVVTVPEPTTLLLTMFAGSVLLIRRKRG